MSTTATVAAVLLGAADAMTAAEIAAAAGLERQPVMTTLFSLKAAGAIMAVETKGEPLRYVVANQDALKARADGKARKGRRRQHDSETPKAAKKRAAKKGSGKKRPAKRKAPKKRKAARRAKTPVASEPIFSFFIDEDSDLQIARRDGVGESAIMPAAEALRLAAFVERHRAALEAA